MMYWMIRWQKLFFVEMSRRVQRMLSASPLAKIAKVFEARSEDRGGASTGGA
jgi:hypothetical protein